MIQLDQYLGVFIDESKENLQHLNEFLLLLEENSDNLALLNDIFRVAHTFKGMSSTMGFTTIADLTHHMENVLDPMRTGKLKVEENVVNLLFKCLDRLENLVNSVIEGSSDENSIEVNDLIEELNGLLKAPSGKPEPKNGKKQSNKGSKKTEEVKEPDMIETPEKSITETTFQLNEEEQKIIGENANKGSSIKHLTVNIDKESMLPAARAYMAYQSVENLGEVVYSYPGLKELETGDLGENFDFVFKMIVLTEQTDDSIKSAVEKISEMESITIQDVTPASMKETESQAEEKETQTAKTTTEQTNGQTNGNNHSNGTAKVIPQTIRVNSDKMDMLMNLVGELVISRTRISQISNELSSHDLTNSISRMGNITSEIQEVVMKLRMVTIDQVFNRFPRLVRDVSKELKKDIHLVIKGEDTEIDRIVIDQIGDPLVHLIRNSLDHGIESREERLAKGKPETGKLELTAFNEGNNIVITVSDDGKGINPEKIRESALRKGLMTEEALKNMTDTEATNLIFLPGLSTNKVATDISGRGVGMDVVKSKVTSLGGDVSVVSKINEGTKITITLPSTMAIVQSLLINVSEETYAMPLNYVSEVIEIERNQIKRVQNSEVIVLRGKTLPLIWLGKILELDTKSNDPNQSLTVLIVKLQDKYLGIIVSQLIGQQEVVIKPINKNLCLEDYISGATTLGNGQVALILNVNALFKRG